MEWKPMRVSLIRLETVSGVTQCELKSGLCHWDFVYSGNRFHAKNFVLGLDPRP